MSAPYKVIYDVFPAKLTVTTTASFDHTQELAYLPNPTGSRKADKVRVIITETHVVVGGDSPNGPITIFRDRIRPGTLRLAKNRNTDVSVLVTETDKVLIFQKDQNCGCGSRLRSWNPYNILNSTADPTE